MSVLIPAFLATLLAAGLAWALGAAMEPRLPARAGVLIWRAARLAALSPLLALGAVVLAPGLRGLVPSSAPTARQGGAGTPVFDGALIPAFDDLAQTAWAAPDWIAPLLGAAYAAGLIWAAARMAARRRALNRLLAASRPAGPALTRMAAQWRERAGLSQDAVTVRVVDAQLSPFVAGLRPVIVLPETLETAPEAAFAMAHEMMHVRRGDERDRLIGEGLAAVLWFNPFVRFIERRMAAARELACDGDVMDRLGEARARDYAAAIAAAAPVAPGSGFLSELRNLRRRRVEAVLKPRRAKRRTAALITAAGLTVLAGAPGAGLALAVNSAGLAQAEPVRQISPRTLSEGVGETVIEIQALMDRQDHAGMLALSAPLLEQDLTAYERSVVLRLEASALFGLNDYAGALDRFERAVETGALTPAEEATIHFNAMQLHAVLEDYEQAVIAADRFLALDQPDGPRQNITLAQIYVQEGRFADALPFAEEGFAALEAPSASQLALLEFIYQELGREDDSARIRARREAMDEE